MIKYSIEKPESDTGIVVLVMKYSTIFIVPWLAGWLFLSFLFTDKSRSGETSESIGNYLGILNIIIALIICFFHIKESLRKYKMGTPFEFTFDHDLSTLSINTINTINDKEKEVLIDYKNLVVIEEQKNNPFLGRQRVYTLTDKSIPRIILNVDLSAWCRHDQLGELIENLRRTSR